MNKLAAIFVAGGILFFAPSVNAAKPDWILLHCVGAWNLGDKFSATNLFFKRDGTAFKRQWSERPVPINQESSPWTFQISIIGGIRRYYFDPRKLTLKEIELVNGDVIGAVTKYACQEISNPFD